METFPCTYFRYATRYPESGSRVQFSRSYIYTQAPEAPDQRIFQLTIQGMCYFLDASGNPDTTSQPGRNMWVLENFYVVHRMHTSFSLNHPVYGPVVCKFNRPLELPQGVAGGGGLLPEFDVELIEIP